jgi:hypothetical protein
MILFKKPNQGVRIYYLPFDNHSWDSNLGNSVWIFVVMSCLFFVMCFQINVVTFQFGYWL